MSRYIDSMHLENQVDEYALYGGHEVLEMICEEPTADVEPITHAKWIVVHPLQEDDDGALMCSACRSGDWSIRMWYKRCPNCGAKMDGN